MLTSIVETNTDINSNEVKTIEKDLPIIIEAITIVGKTNKAT